MGGRAWTNARRVLCVRLDTIGDVLMTTPAIRACKGERRHVTLLTSRAGAAIAPLVPEINDVVAADMPWVKNAAPLRDSKNVHELADELRRRRFDGAVIFTVHSQNPLPAAMLCWLADIPLRLAYCRENPYQLLTDWVREPDGGAAMRHEVRRQLDLVAEVGWRCDDERLSLAVSERDREAVTRKLDDSGLNTRGAWAVLHPGATAPSRRYPAEMYAHVAATLAERGVTVAVTGSDDERSIVERVVAGAAGVQGFAGAFDLPELAALLSLAPVLVSNNTGPAHMAAALGTPVVDVYALTNLQHRPWMTPSRVLTHDVPCANCMSSICSEGHHDCLRLIAPETVVDATFDLLRETACVTRNASATSIGV